MVLSMPPAPWPGAGAVPPLARCGGGGDGGKGGACRGIGGIDSSRDVGAAAVSCGGSTVWAADEKSENSVSNEEETGTAVVAVAVVADADATAGEDGLGGLLEKDALNGTEGGSRGAVCGIEGALGPSTFENVTAAAPEGDEVAVGGFTDDDNGRVVDPDGGLRERPNERPWISPGGGGGGADDGSTTRPPHDGRELHVGPATFSVAVVAGSAFEAAVRACMEALDCLE